MRTAFLILSIFAASVFGADTYIVATITPTNAPTTNGQTLTINAATRTMTNNATGSPATSIATNNTLGGIATNVARALQATRPFVGGFIILTPTNVVLRAENNTALAVSIGGSWGTVSLSTNLATNSIAVRIPFEVEPIATRTNVASYLVSGLSQYSTQAFATNATALSNFVNLGTDSQRIVNKQFTNATIQGGSISNSILTNIARANIGQAIITNATIHGGNATNLNLTSATGDFRNGYFSNVIGHSVTITNLSADTVSVMANPASGYATIALDNYWNIAGNSGGDLFIENTDNGDVPVRFSSSSGGGTVFTLPVTVSNNIVATGSVTSASATFQSGLLATNATLRGTNTINGGLILSPRSNTSLANGNNAGVILGTNVVVTLSGATTVANIAGFAAEPAGSWHIVRITGSVTNNILNDSGLDATAANRITTRTGGTRFSTNSVTILHVWHTGSNWELQYID
jgi:hypothetical protein